MSGENDTDPVASGRRQTANQILDWMKTSDIAIPETIHSPWNGTIGKLQVFCFTDIGGRRSQEDRFIVCPRLVTDRDDCSLFGVYDGTVGNFASDTVKDLVMPQLWGSPSWQNFVKRLPHAEKLGEPAAQEELRVAMTDLHVNSDLELIDLCAERQLHYAAATSATCLLAGPYLCVGHLGDSRIAQGWQEGDALRASFLTCDHKPDQPVERDRIISNGGSVEYLVNHNRKPFIRGGDFTIRKSRGEQPMQLQYSRAFGGKDLKMFGLSRDPDVAVFTLNNSIKCLIIASDGLWDVRSADEAVQTALEAHSSGTDPAKALVELTVKEMNIRRQAADNITAVVIMFS